MKPVLFIAFLFAAAPGGFSQTARNFDRKAYYTAMREDDKNLVVAELKKLKIGPAELKPFEGALTMKQAGLGGGPAKKLSLFKQGHKVLEAAIKANPNNAEFRFLRLMIQEHAPGILGYKNDMTADSEYIKKSYKSLPGDVQRAITDYSKKSKVLKLGVS